MKGREIEVLLKFLEQNVRTAAGRKLLSRAGIVVKDYARIGRLGQLPLIDPCELARHETARVVGLATGRKVKSVMFLSASRPRTVTVWRSRASMPTYEHQTSKTLVRQVRHSIFRRPIWRLLMEDSAGDFWRLVGGTTCNELFDALDRAVWKDLKDCFTWNTPIDAVRDELRACLRLSLMYLLGLVLIGDEKRFRRLLPLINLMPLVLPIGEKADQSGAWLVLAA